MREYGILIALIAIMAFFQIATDGVLLRPVNLTNIVLQNRSAGGRRWRGRWPR
jgi:putative multiple sugar transport system permease protein